MLATDFSPGMVARITAAGLPNAEAQVMDGQALDLPDAGFDAVFSIFGATMAMPQAMAALSDLDDFARQLVAAGFRDPRIEYATHDFDLDVAALAQPDTLFGMSPDWTGLDDEDKAAIVAEVRRMAGDRPILPIASTALIGVATRRSQRLSSGRSAHPMRALVDLALPSTVSPSKPPASAQEGYACPVVWLPCSTMLPR